MAIGCYASIRPFRMDHFVFCMDREIGDDDESENIWSTMALWFFSLFHNIVAADDGCEPMDIN